MAKSDRFIPTNKLHIFDLFNNNNEDLGQVQNLIVDRISGRIAFVIVSYGGMLGISDKWFAIPWDIMVCSPETHRFIVDIPTQVLETSPGLHKDKWMEEINNEWLIDCYMHYGLSPYWTNTTEPMEERIKKLAYTIWESEGKPNGRDIDHYLRAEQILRARSMVGEQVCEDILIEV